MYAGDSLLASGEALPAADRADWPTSDEESAKFRLVVTATAATEILRPSDETARRGIEVADAWLVLSRGVERERLKQLSPDGAGVLRALTCSGVRVLLGS